MRKTIIIVDETVSPEEARILKEKLLEERVKELEDAVFKRTINCICRDECGKLVAKVDGSDVQFVLNRNNLR